MESHDVCGLPVVALNIQSNPNGLIFFRDGRIDYTFFFLIKKTSSRFT
jgi:hypothetical protein